jgi:large repetitive protein
MAIRRARDVKAIEIAENGGGIYVYGGSVTARNTTIADNSGQGVLLNSTNSSFANSTISGNQSSGNVGGISTIWGGVTLANVTVTNNRAQKNSTTGLTGVGGIYAGNATNVILYNSIVAENYVGQVGSAAQADLKRETVYNPGSSLFPGTISGTYNLIGVGVSGGPSDGVNGNMVGTLGTPQEPKLMALSNYGGPTRTHRLESDSDAIVAGDDSMATTYDLAFDQRGLDRIVDGDLKDTDTIDIGAFELTLAEL